MKDEEKTKGQLIYELTGMRQRIAEFKALESERNRVEEALRESEEKYRFLVDNSKEIALIISKSGKILFANRIVLTSFGYPKEEIIGKSITKFITKDFIKKALSALAQEFLGHTQPEMEVQIKAKSGEIRYLEIAKGSTPVHEKGKLIGVLISARDITERKQAEEELKNSEERYRIIIDSSPIGIYYSDLYGNFLYGNKKAEEIIGYKNEELIGKNFLKLKLLSPKDIGRATKIFAFHKLGKTTGPNEFVLTRKDRAKAVVEINAEVINVEGKKVVLGMVQDITQRKRQEKVMQESERRFKDIAENALEWIWECDTNGKYIYASPIVKEILGYKPEEVLEKHFYDLFHPEDRERLKKEAFKVFAKKHPFHEFITRNIQKNGKTVWTSKSGVSILDERGNLLGYRGAATDITERKQAEEELLESENKYKVLTDSSLTGIFIHQNGKYVFVNDKFSEIHGSKNEELLGKDHLALIHPDEREFVKQMREKRLKGKTAPHSYEIKRLRKDGETIWCEMMATVIQHRGRPAIMGNVIDITDRKQAEKALKQSEEKYRTILENIEDAYYEVDLAGNFTFFNDSLGKILGYSKDELMGVNNRQHTDKENDKMIYQAFNKVYRTGKPNIGTQYEIIRKDGTRRQVEASASLMKDAEDKPIGFRGIIRDITQRKQAEEELKGYAAELERSNQELEQFAYIASHDLQEPLRMVASYTQLLARRYRGKLDSDADEFIAYAVDGATRMQGLINDLLTYSRIGTKGKDFEPTDCEAVFDRTLDNLQKAVEESGAKISHDPLPTVMADGMQLGQLFQNLIGNAIKFRSEEHPSIHVSCERIEESAIGNGQSAMNKGWVFSVRDNGIGIDPEFTGRIFIIFQRLHKRGEYPGSGIGLAICKKIVERHGGRIWVESDPGKGSTFYFTIPLRGENSHG